MITQYKSYDTYTKAENARKSKYQAAIDANNFDIFYGVHMLDETTFIIAEHDTKTQSVNKFLEV